MSSSLHVGLEATAACRRVHTGIARYAYNLMRVLASEGQARGERYTAYGKLSRLWKKGCKPDPIEHLDWRWYSNALPLMRDEPDLMHGLEMVVPKAFRGPCLATVHDLFGIVSKDLLNPAACERNASRYAKVAERCDHVIAVSESTKRDFLRFHDYPEDRIHVVHLGVEPDFGPRPPEELALLRKRLDLPAPFLLYVGDLTPRKNLLRLLQAFADSDASKEHELVIVGAREDGSGELSEALRKSSARERVRILGWIPDEDLLGLYAAAEALLFPTLYEGFGLPILEALASGTPALGSSTGSVPEIAGGFATLVDPMDIDSIREGIEAVVETPIDLRAAAGEHARSFTWERCGERTRAVYRAALA